MAVIRVEKTKNYTTMSNYHLRDTRLSLKAKGLLSIMLSLPNNWNYTIEGIIDMVAEGESAVKATLNELKKNGYLRIDKKSGKDGRFEYEYVVFEHPDTDNSPEGDFPAVDFPAVEEPEVDKPEVENHPVNKILNNKILTKKENTSYSRKKERFTPPTVEEIKEYCQERNNKVDAQKVYDFYSANNWKDSNGKPIKNWKQKIIGVWERNKPKENKVPDFTWDDSSFAKASVNLMDLPF